MFSTIALLNVSVAAAQFIQVAWISKAYGADSLALFALVAGAFAPTMSFLSAGQRFSLLARGRLAQAHIHAHRRLRRIGILSIAVLLAIYIAVTRQLDPRLLSLAGLIAAYRLSDSSAEINAWVYQVQADKRRFIMQSLVRVVPIPTACMLSWMFALDLLSFLFASAAIAAAMYLTAKQIFADPYAPRRLVAGNDWRDLRNALIVITPVGLAAAIESLVIIIPRYYLASVGSFQNVAEYVLITQISGALGVVASAKLQADMPSYAMARQSDRRAMMRKLVIAVSTVVVGLLLIGTFLGSSPAKGFLAHGLGHWVLSSEHMFALLPPLMAAWYGGGYIANVSSIMVGEQWQLYMAILLVGALSLGLILASQSSSHLLESVVASLVVASSLRLVTSYLRIRSHLKQHVY